MKKLVAAILLILLTASPASAQSCEVSIDGANYCDFGVTNYSGLFSSNPAVSPAGAGRIYFDGDESKFKCSEDGSAYVDMCGAGTEGAVTGPVSSTDSVIAVFSGVDGDEIKEPDGDINANTQKIINVVDPTADQHAATKKYVDDNFVPTTQVYSKCFILPDTAAADDDIPLGSFVNAVTVTGVWCTCSGTCTTKAQFSLEDGAGNAMTITGSTPTCTDIGTVPNSAAVTAGNTLTARESIRFDVTNTPNPETDAYEICFSYTEN